MLLNLVPAASLLVAENSALALQVLLAGAFPAALNSVMSSLLFLLAHSRASRCGSAGRQASVANAHGCAFLRS